MEVKNVTCLSLNRQTERVHQVRLTHDSGATEGYSIPLEGMAESRSFTTNPLGILAAFLHDKARPVSIS